MRPPHLFTAGPAVLNRLRVDACANVAPRAATNIRITIIAAATVNVNTDVATLPAMRDCAARPASSGPVQENPAARYPKPYRTWLEKRVSSPISARLRSMG